MKRQCAWFGLVISQPHRSQDKRITHTICPPCAEQILLEAGLPASDIPGWLAAEVRPGSPDLLQKVA